MSGDSATVGQVLGASTAVGGIAMLPATGDSMLGLVLSITAITLGAVCLLSFFLTRLLKRTFAK